MLEMMPKNGNYDDDQISYCDHISSTRLAPFIFQRFHELLGLMTQTCYLLLMLSSKTFLRGYQHGIDSRVLLDQMNGLVSSIELAIKCEIMQPRASVK